MEVFVWGTQEDGNPRFTIRDCMKKTLFHIDLESREYWHVKKMKEQVIPLIVELMNRYAGEVSAANEINSVGVVNLPRKRGRPRKHG